MCIRDRLYVHTYIHQPQQLAGSSLLACLHTVTAAATSVHTAAAVHRFWIKHILIILLGFCSFPAYVVLILCSNSTLVFHLKKQIFPLKFQHSAETKLVSSFLPAISFGRVVRLSSQSLTPKGLNLTSRAASSSDDPFSDELMLLESTSSFFLVSFSRCGDAILPIL